MAFTNEPVSVDDPLKAELQTAWSKVSAFPPYQYRWTIDRDRNAFLFSFDRGREEFGDRVYFGLWLNSSFYRFQLREKTSFGADAISTVWHPVSMTQAHSDVILVLKDALTVYQLRGSGEILPLPHNAAFTF